MKIKLKNSRKNSIESIEKLEADVNVLLPDGYKSFLMNNNGGYTEGTYCFDRKLEDSLQTIAIENFFSIEEIYEVNENLKDWELYSGLLAIAQSLGSPTICIGIGGENYGKIIILDGDFGATEQNNFFDDFMEQLKECK